MAVNNEVGNYFDLAKISKIVHSYSHAYFISDVSQGIGKIEIDYSLLDGFTMSGHKIHGLKSSGFACFKKNVKINPMILGGKQQDNYRSGTIDVPLNCCLATAIRIYFSTFKERYLNCKSNYEYLYNKLLELKDEITINSNISNSSYYILNFSLLNKKASVLVESLSSKEVYVSTQSACSSKTQPSSYVLKNMGFSSDIASNSIRVSFSGNETKEYLDEFVNILKEELDKLIKR